MPAKASEDGDYVLWRLVSLVDYDYTPMNDCAEEWGVGVVQNTGFQVRCKHELVYSRIAMELHVFPGSS